MTSPKPRDASRRGLPVAGLLLLLATPFVVGGAAESPSLERNRQRIESMTEAERARLQRNLRTFLDLSEAERNHYRDMHRQLEEDRLNNGKLRDLLEEYNTWLASLSSPWQRKDILETRDPIERARLIKKNRDEQQKQRQERFGPRRWGMGGRGQFGWGRMLMGRRLEPEYRLSPADFDAVIKVVADSLKLDAGKRKMWDALPVHVRHVKVLKEARELHTKELQNMRQPAAPVGPPQDRLRGGFHPWLDDKLIKSMTDAVSEAKVRDRLQGKALPLQRQRQMLGSLIFDGLVAEWRPELEKQKPSEAELRDFLAGLDPQERNVIITMPSEEERKWRLSWLYLRRTGNGDVKDFGEVIEWLPRATFDWPGPPDARRGNRGPDPNEPGRGGKRMRNRSDNRPAT